MTLSPNMCYLYKCEQATVRHVSEKRYQSHTQILTISNGMNISLLPPCFSVLEMYIQSLNYQVFPMKTSKAFLIWKKCMENKWEGNRVPLGERKLDCTLTEEPHNYIAHFV